MGVMGRVWDVMGFDIVQLPDVLVECWLVYNWIRTPTAFQFA